MLALKAENLSKEYMIGGKRKGPGSLHEVLSESLLAPFRRLLRGGGSAEREERFWALKDVSFEVRAGERLGIIGKNGAGKSTLLKILSRITEPTAGRVEVTGRVNSLLEVGTGFHPELTGRENVYLNGAILGMSRAEITRKFDEIVEFAEVERFLDTPVKHYSSGMYVRLAFAVAAHLEPEILVVDEVLAVGDIQFQKKCLGKMEEAGREGRTILFVSHNLSAVRALCSRALLLQEGGLKADGSVADVVGKYLVGSDCAVYVVEWKDRETAPQNGSALLRGVAVRDDSGAPVDAPSTDDPLNIVIEYEIKEAGGSAGFTLNFFDHENASLFNSISNHETNWYGKTMPSGVYRTRCRIPAHLLNAGTFVVGVNFFGKGFSDARVLRNVLRIEVRDGSHVRNDYYGEFTGPFRPLLEWRTEPM